MGMFDEVKCQYPLPDPQVQNAVFQTKDFDCELKTYTITEDGRLLCNTFDAYEVIERPDSFLGFRLQRINEHTIEVEYHGDLYFYTMVGLKLEWFEYVARFTNGRVEWIKRMEATP